MDGQECEFCGREATETAKTHRICGLTVYLCKGCLDRMAPKMGREERYGGHVRANATPCFIAGKRPMGRGTGWEGRAKRSLRDAQARGWVPGLSAAEHRQFVLTGKHDPLEAIVAAKRDREDAETRLQRAVRSAKTAGVSVADVARQLGMTRQGVYAMLARS